MDINYRSSFAFFFCLALPACSSVGPACRAPNSPTVLSPSESLSEPPATFSRQVLEVLPSFRRSVYITKIIDDRGPRPKDPTVSGAVLPKGDMSPGLRESLKSALETDGVKFG